MGIFSSKAVVGSGQAVGEGAAARAEHYGEKGLTRVAEAAPQYGKAGLDKIADSSPKMGKIGLSNAGDKVAGGIADGLTYVAAGTVVSSIITGASNWLGARTRATIDRQATIEKAKIEASSVDKATEKVDQRVQSLEMKLGQAVYRYIHYQLALAVVVMYWYSIIQRQLVTQQTYGQIIDSDLYNIPSKHYPKCLTFMFGCMLLAAVYAWLIYQPPAVAGVANKLPINSMAPTSSSLPYLHRVVSEHCTAYKEGSEASLKVAACWRTLAETLIDSGYNIDERCINGATAMHVACQLGSLEVVKFLHKQGANLYAVMDWQITPIFLAANHGHHGIVQFLLETMEPTMERWHDEPRLSPMFGALLEYNRDIIITLFQTRYRAYFPLTETVTGRPMLDVVFSPEYVHEETVELAILLKRECGVKLEYCSDHAYPLNGLPLKVAIAQSLKATALSHSAA